MARRIMIVDDDPSFVSILTRRLVANGYMVLSAFSGEDLLTKLDGFHPDVILLDVMMPGMDGLQVAKRLEQGASTAAIPIVFCSALISTDYPQEFPANPRYHYLGKPFEPEVLLALLKRIDQAG